MLLRERPQRTWSCSKKSSVSKRGSCTTPTGLSQKCLFNRDLLQRASSDYLSDHEVARVRSLARRAALEAMEDALQGRPRAKRRDTTGLAQHLKTEAKAALLVLVDAYGVPHDWRPFTAEPDDESAIADEPQVDVADYHDNAEDSATRSGGVHLRGNGIDNLADQSEDTSEYQPLSAREWLLSSRAIQQRALARQFRNLRDR